MSYRSIAVYLLFFCSTTLIVAGCSSTPTKSDELEAAQKMDAAMAFEAASGWISDDAMVVVAGAGETGWETVGEGLLPTANPHAPAGSLGTLEGVRTDLEVVLRRYFGFDPMQTEAAVVGVSLMGGSMVLFGDFDEPEGLPELSINGRTAYDLNFGAFLDAPVVDLSVVVMPIDEPRRGLVVAMGSESLRQLDNAEQGAGTLAFGQRGQLYSQLFEDALDASVAVASPIGEYGMMMGMMGSLPDAVMLTYGDTLGVTLQGSSHVLGEIERIVEAFVVDVRHEVDEEYHNDDSDQLMERLFNIYGYHLVESVAGQLHPRVSDERLHYEVSVSELDMESMMVLGALTTAGWMFFMAEEDEYYGDHQGAAGYEETIFTEPHNELPVIADHIIKYFNDQDFECLEGAYCEEPWNDDAENGEQEKVFPGGKNIKVMTMADVPEGAMLSEVDPQFEGDVDIDIEAEELLEFVGIPLESESYFRYTYETGVDADGNATAHIRAEANWQPWTSERHTIIQDIFIDWETGEARALPMITKDEYQ